jgi:class 3 adenylate cyclase/tetratricopeptide (TPR) repeat protein
MQCQTCGAPNTEGMKFCGGCGNALQQPCPACGACNPPQFKYCGSCGRPIGPPIPSPVPARSISGSQNGLLEKDDAERRQLTVMFCDLVGSTALSLELDPEELREVIQAYQETCVSVIEEYAGYTAQYLGDGILVYFGYPAAQEYEAERAVRAGLRILASIGELNRQLQKKYDVNLAVRISLHTGIAVIGRLGGGSRHEHLAMGTAPNLAARLQSLAEPGTLVVSGSTYRLLRDLFVCEDLGAHLLKGAADPMQVYRIDGEKEDALAIQNIPSEAETVLVGRHAEIALLLERWRDVEAGNGQAVLISGEPGIGKSNLTRSLESRLQHVPHTVLVCRCEPHCQNTVFYPIAYMLQRALNFYPGQLSDERLDTIEFMLDRNGIDTREAAPLLASLLSVPTNGRYDGADSSSRDVRLSTQQVILKLLLQTAEEQPVLLIFEDLHWADPSSLELIGYLLDQAARARLLVLLTFRPLFSPPWPARSYMAQLTLNRFSPREAGALVRSVIHGRDLPGDVLEELIRKADGVPLFIEELTKMVVEAGLVREDGDRYVRDGPLPPLSIPASLQDSLMARLDRLSPVKELAQLGAAIGREFSYDLIQAVSAMEDETLQSALGNLVDSELLHQRGLPPKATYSFKHALIQDAAYESLLKSRRQHYHQLIADVLESRFPEVCKTQPELIAHHLTAAGLNEQAASYWLKAGEFAAWKSAYHEAAHHFSQGLEALSLLKETDGLNLLRLSLLNGLGASQLALKGYTAPAVRNTFEEARLLLYAADHPSHATAVLTGLFSWYFVNGDFCEAQGLAEDLLTHASQTGDSQAKVAANITMGATLFRIGHLDDARGYLEEALRHYKPGEHFSVALMGQDLGVAALSYLADTLWTLGDTEASKAHMHEAVSLARRIDHPHSLALALFFAATLYHQLQDSELALHYARDLAHVSEKYAFRHWQAESGLMEAWALANEGRFNEALAKVTHVLNEHRGVFSAGDVPGFSLFLAETYLRAGAQAELLHYLRKALHHTVYEGETVWTPEIWRLTGEALLLERPDLDEAETCFRKAVEIAHRQGSRALELRAILSLARLWDGMERRDDRRHFLQDTLANFALEPVTAEQQQAWQVLHGLA